MSIFVYCKFNIMIMGLYKEILEKIKTEDCELNRYNPKIMSSGNVLMLEQQYHLLDLLYKDKDNVIKNTLIPKNKDFIYLSVFNKGGLLKVKYYFKKHLKFHVYKGTQKIYVADKLSSINQIQL